MEDEIIYEESKMSNKVKAILLVVIMLVIILGIVIVFRRNNFNVKKNITLELGDRISTNVRDYITNKPLNDKDYKLSIDSVAYDNNYVLNAVGEYTYRVTFKDTIKEGKIIVKDTKAPDVSTIDITIGVNENFIAEDFIASCNDYSLPCSYDITNDVDTSKTGTYDVSIKAKDEQNNEKMITAKLTVKEGYSLKEAKTKDLEPKFMEPSYDDWNKQYVVKFAGGLDPDDSDNYRWQYYYDFLDDDMSDYLDDNHKGKTIKNTEIIAIYNQYHYIIGFACRATLADGSITYLTNGE
jgi:hypothetical protein